MDDCCIARAILRKANAVTILRPASGTYDNHGRWQEYEDESFVINAVVQPVRPEDLQYAEEGWRTDGAIKVFCTDELRTASITNRTNPDIILWKEQKYQVKEVKDWTEFGGYYQVLAIRLGQ